MSSVLEMHDVGQAVRTVRGKDGKPKRPAAASGRQYRPEPNGSARNAGRVDERRLVRDPTTGRQFGPYLVRRWREGPQPVQASEPASRQPVIMTIHCRPTASRKVNRAGRRLRARELELSRHHRQPSRATLGVSDHRLGSASSPKAA
jgi:hypothetical protein